MGKKQEKKVHHKYHPVHSSSREKLHATQFASLMYQAITYLVLCQDFGFTVDQIQKVQDGMARISARITDPDDDYEVMSVVEDLMEYDIELDKEDFIKIFLGGPNATL